MLNRKATIILLTVGLIKKDSINKWIFSRTKIRRVKIELDLSNYATKVDLKKYSRYWYIKIY